MKKDEILKYLDIASFSLIIIATCLVLIFEFVGTYALMKVSIILYFVGLLLLTVLLAMRVYFAFAKAKNNASDNQGSEVTESSNSISKGKKASLIAMLVVSAAALIFTLVIMIMF